MIVKPEPTFDPYASHIDATKRVVRDPSDPRLHVVSKKVDPHSSESLILGQTLLKFHDYLGGFGLAAPQIGVNKMMCVIRHMPGFPDSFDGKNYVLINPRIVDYRIEQDNVSWYTEGCFSNPGVRAEVCRPKQIKVECQFLGSNKKQILTVAGMTARIIGHEVDHLNGKLFTELPFIRNIKIVANEQAALIGFTEDSLESGAYDKEPEVDG